METSSTSSFGEDRMRWQIWSPIRFSTRELRRSCGGVLAAGLFALGLLGGCASTRLAHNVDDEAIASVPLLERQEVLAAQDEVAQAKADEVRYEQRTEFLNAEKKRLETALSAAQAKQAAVQGDAKVVAGREVALAKARLDHVVARQVELDALKRTVGPRHRAAQASYELAKARLVWTMGLPAKAKVADLALFEKQAKETRAAYEASQTDVTAAADRVAMAAAAVATAEQALSPPKVAPIQGDAGASSPGNGSGEAPAN